MLKKKGIKNLLKSIVIDTGPLLLPLTREYGWDRIRELLIMHEKGEVSLYIGLFNVAELVYILQRLGFDTDVSQKYAKLISERLNIVNTTRYVMWMGKLRVEAYKHGYNIPWGNISSAAAAATLNIPVLVLDEDKHFDRVIVLCKELGRTVEIIHVKELVH